MSLVETIIVALLVALTFAAGLPFIRAASVEASLLCAGRIFKGEFLRARSIAARSGANTAIRFERVGETTFFSVYMDGNHNGVLSDDIRRGIDHRLSGPYLLNARVPGVRVGINPGVTEPPPGHGLLDTSRPIRFGNSQMVSFSPLGTATPGTFYLAGQGIQAAVRVVDGTARVRLLIYRGGSWSEK